MLGINLNKTDTKSLYIQLYEALAEDISAGRIAAGSRLPSKRQLSEQLGISQSTVLGAYELLIDNGYIQARERSGYYVNSIRLDPDDPEEHERASRHQYSFSSNGVALDHRCEAFVRIVERLSFRADTIYNSYIDGLGDVKLNHAICSYLYKLHGVSCTPQQIVIAAGVEYLTDALLRIFDSNSTIAFESPCNNKMHDLIRQRNFKRICNIDTCNGKIDIDALYSSGADILLAQSCYTFPANETVLDETKLQILSWCAKQSNRYIIEGMHDNEFYYGNTPPKTMFSMDYNNRVILAGSFRRSIGCGVPLAYMVLPKNLIDEFNRHNILYMPLISNFIQLACEEFIRTGEIYKNIDKLKKTYLEKRDYAIRCFKNSALRDKIEIFGTDAGTHFCIKVNDQRSSAQLRELALNKGVKLARLAVFMQNPSPEKYKNAFIFGYGESSKEDLKNGIKLLEAAWI